MIAFRCKSCGEQAWPDFHRWLDQEFCPDGHQGLERVEVFPVADLPAKLRELALSVEAVERAARALARGFHCPDERARKWATTVLAAALGEKP